MPSIDPDAIARLRRFGGDALLFEMIDLLLSGAPKRLDAARLAVAAGAADPVRAALHSLKSTTGQLGAAQMQAMCERGEGLAAAGDLAGLAALMPDLDAEYDAVRRRLETIRRGEG
jgi:HPt (histidine-containing phosphotransfer) domain-containing protein